MKTQPKYPHRERNTGALISRLIVAAIMLAIPLAFTSCTVSTAPDGTVTKTPDYNAWIEIVRLIQNDEITPIAIPVNPTK